MEAKRVRTRLVTGLLVLTALILISLKAGGGSLEPNSPPGPTMHTLEEIYDLVSSQGEPPAQPSGFIGFLQVEGIGGESIDENHKGWIEVLSYSQGITQQIASAVIGPGRVGERCDHQDFSVVKTLDKASPKLALFCCTGQHIPEIKLELCRPEGEKTIFMEYKMKDAIVSSYDYGKPSGDVKTSEILPVEEVSFNYGKIEWTYTETDGNSVYGGWDVDANSPIIPGTD